MKQSYTNGHLRLPGIVHSYEYLSNKFLLPEDTKQLEHLRFHTSLIKGYTDYVNSTEAETEPITFKS